jgi:hypothetical protein
MIDTLEGWTTNAKEVDVALARAEGLPFSSGSGITSRHWMYMSLFPLASALEVRESLAKASYATMALVRLHYSALKSQDPHAELFLLAKGLELGQRFLPGKSHRQRQSELPEDVQKSMRHSLSWLFEMSNNRFDIRHVVKDPAGPHLHPDLTASERSEFIADADLVIRTVICMQLRVKPFVVSRQE